MMNDLGLDFDFGDLDDTEEVEEEYCFECEQYIDEDGLCDCVRAVWDDDDFKPEDDFNSMFSGMRLG